MNFQDITKILAEEKNIVYHAGTLQGKSDKFFQMSSPRSTGYFGTGYYFVVNLNNIKNFSKDKTVYSFDVSGLKLARGTKKLHQALKYLTFIVQDYDEVKEYINPLRYNSLPDDLSIYSQNALNNLTSTISELVRLGMNRNEWEKIVSNLYKKSLNADKQGDSISTMFMKSLGYQGVYPTPECDNTEFGGVIYEKNNIKDVKLVS